MRERNEQIIWDTDQAKAYAQNRHGVDGKQFLDPHIYDFLKEEDLSGQDFLDIGCGTGPWSLYALQQGALSVTAIDANKAMTDQARILLQVNGSLPANVSIEEHDANNMPADWNGRFGRLVSINVGCNLADLRQHFAEAYRVACAGATMLVTAPNSLTTVFDDGGAHGIDELLVSWEKLEGDQKNLVTAKRMISQLSHVHRATFQLLSSQELRVVDNELPPGTRILRRIPGLAVDNNFHKPDMYIEEATSAGWNVSQVHESRFPDEAARQSFNDMSEIKLGEEYVKKPPFFVMKLQK